MKTLKFKKTRVVKSPERGTGLSAGIDFFIPDQLTLNEMSSLQKTKGDVQCQVDGKHGIIVQYILPPQKRILIPSGIKVKFPKGYCGLFVDKSGVSSKSGLTLLAKLIDEDYQGEVFLNVVNTSDTPVKFFPGQKLAQMILLESNIVDIQEVATLDDLYNGVETERGEGGFGSTNEPVKQQEKTVTNEDSWSNSVPEAPNLAPPAETIDTEEQSNKSIEFSAEDLKDINSFFEESDINADVDDVVSDNVESTKDLKESTAEIKKPKRKRKTRGRPKARGRPKKSRRKTKKTETQASD